MAFLSDLSSEWQEANKPHLLLWLFIWMIETNILLFVFNRSDLIYDFPDYFIIYIIVAVSTTILLNPVKEIKRNLRV